MIIIIDYGMGNVGSIYNMLKKIGISSKVSGEPKDILAAEKLILPGVGAFDHGMTHLLERGLIPLLNKKVLENKCPILGICLGMQLLSCKSEEGKLPGLGWLEAETRRFQFNEENSHLKIPHMGWNEIRAVTQAPLFAEFDKTPRFYFVHSYHVCCDQPQDVMATSYYGYEFTAAVKKGNIIGTQFHPEKSHRYGMHLLRNFANL
ncbi:MAG: imidazole glycerol phosphate synthase subunit HisH [Smithellaceae bacterium]